MNNILTVAELKRRGMAAIEDGLRRGPVHIVKRNRPAAVVLSEAEYQRLAQGRMAVPGGLSALQWLLAQPASGQRSKAQLDSALRAERTW
jgi:prevent-host-death family protein